MLLRYLRREVASLSAAPSAALQLLASLGIISLITKLIFRTFIPDPLEYLVDKSSHDYQIREVGRSWEMLLLLNKKTSTFKVRLVTVLKLLETTLKVEFKN